MQELRQVYAGQREADKKAKLNKLKHEHIINTIMASQEGRDFVKYILWLLKFHQPNSENSANVYKTAALQNAAIFIYEDIYAINPDLCEKMMREARNNDIKP